MSEIFQPAYSYSKALILRFFLMLVVISATFIFYDYLYVLIILFFAFAIALLFLFDVYLPCKPLLWQSLRIDEDNRIVVQNASISHYIDLNHISSTSIYYSSLDKKIGSATLCIHKKGEKKFCLPGIVGVDSFLTKYIKINHEK